MSLFRRKKKFTVNEPDPTYSVIYLGNVVTILAKGEASYERPLSLIWKTYQSKTRPDLQMQLTVVPSGLKAVTKQQGLTEYWAHRITFCVAPENYPRVFVWIYKHEGKKMKPELRCHAALCRKADVPAVVSFTLQERVVAALQDYKREKLRRQNYRVSINTVPQRKLMLSTGGQNFRPPMERSKSAPKLHSIEEESTEESEEEFTSVEEAHFDAPVSEVGSLDMSDPTGSDSPRDPQELDDLTICENPHGLDDGDLFPKGPTPTFRRSHSVDCNNRRKLADAEDTVSDESGYQEEKSSFDDDAQESDQENRGLQMTAF